MYVNDKILRSFEENPAGGIFYIGNCMKDDEIRVNLHVLYDDEFESTPQEIIGFRTARVDENALMTFVNNAKQNPMIIDSMRDSNIKAHVTMGENQLLFTSIPYDKGWNVYENGKKLNIIAVADSFVGVELQEGYHEIEFKYSPPGFFVGGIIMIFSWIVFVILMIILKRKNLNDNRVPTEAEE